MANAEHIEILKSGVEKWNEWREKNGEVSANLSEADLFDTNLSGADLKGAKLSDAKLPDANLSFADLSEADLYRAKLYRANLFEANLYRANLFEADLSEADLSFANLSGADLSFANLSGVNLSRVKLHRANLSKADLSGADLSDADLSDADLSGANFTNSKFENTNLLRCKLGATVFGLTDFSTCKGLDMVAVYGPCVIDFPTLRASKNLPKEFLTKLGIPDLLMEYLPEFYNSALKIYPAFLSHSWGDKEFVRNLYDALSKKGVTVWLDEKKMKPGDNIHDSISEGIKYYDKLILVCSENALNSWWVEKELEKVYEKEREMQKERGKKFRLVIPIRIDDNILNWQDGILTTVRNSMIGDFTKWQDEIEFEKAVKGLVDALNANRPDVKPMSLLK